MREHPRFSHPPHPARHHPEHGDAGPGRPAHGHGRGGRRGGRGRVPRGDVRAAVLLLLDEQPMHGYQLMQAIDDRTGGAWQPSPGAIYPTLNQLEDEGLVSVTADAGRRLATLTPAGRELVADQRETWPDPFAGFAGDRAGGADLRRAVMAIHDAARHVGRSGTAEQVSAATRILDDARRGLYLLLADGEAAPH